GRLGELFQVVFVIDEKGEADEFRRPEVGDVQVVGGIGATHVERVRGPLRADHAEVDEELLGFIEAGRLQPPIGKVGDFYEGHRRSPLSSLLMEMILAPHPRYARRMCGCASSASGEPSAAMRPS